MSAAVEPLVSIYQDDPDFREILGEFVATLPERKAQLTAAFAAGSVGDVGRHAHQLKGAGGGYGYSPISEAAARLEDACRCAEPNLDEIGRLLDVVTSQLSRVFL